MGHSGRCEDHYARERQHKLRDHPNFSLPRPGRDEGLIQYALRCAAHLVSPPQGSAESSDVECVAVAEQITELEASVVRGWNARGDEVPG